MDKELRFPNGVTVPKLGQGTWKMGEGLKSEQEEVEALKTGIKRGLTLLDTAEMYAGGQAERILGRAIKDFNREDLFIVSKVVPSNAGKDKIYQAVDQSLERLGTDYLDLYLLHWRGSVPLQETVDAFEGLINKGKIRSWGVSNFDTAGMKDLLSVDKGENVQTNQVLYHLGDRGIEYDLTSYMRDKDIPLMAYCPLIGQDPQIKREVLQHTVTVEIAKKHNITETQLLLAWVLEQSEVLPIPKSGSKEHTELNADTLEVNLDREDLEALDQAFPAPDSKRPMTIR